MSILQKLILLCGPSGAGKTTIAKYLLDTIPELQFSISITTRPQRSHEQEGKDYYFIDQSTFEEKIKNDELAEYQEVYPGLYYGTLRSELERIATIGHVPVLDVDVQGALHIQTQILPGCLSLFVHPVNLENLRERLEARGTETEETLVRRLGKASTEMSFAGMFSAVLYNDNLDAACGQALKLAQRYLLKDLKLERKPLQ